MAPNFCLSYFGYVCSFIKTLLSLLINLKIKMHITFCSPFFTQWEVIDLKSLPKYMLLGWYPNKETHTIIKIINFSIQINSALKFDFFFKFLKSTTTVNYRFCSQWKNEFWKSSEFWASVTQWVCQSIEPYGTNNNVPQSGF